jgi:hypothetical protein
MSHLSPHPRKTILWIPGAALLAATIAFTAACGGDSDENGSSPGTTGDTATPVITVDAEPGSFEQLAADYLNGVDGRVKYDVDSENFGFHPVGTWITYRLGDEIREDWTTNNFGYDETTIALIASSGMLLCTVVVSTTSCSAATEISQLDAVLILFTPIKDYPLALLGDDGPDYQATELPGETIAGVDAQCFDVAVDGRIGDGPPGTEQVKLCFSEDGTLLAYDRTVTFEASGFDPARLTAIAQEAGEAKPEDFLPPDRTQPTGASN